MAKAERPAPKKKKKRLNKKFKKFIGWLIQITLIIILSALVAFGCFGSVTMQEGSMEPTIHANDELRISRAAYFFGSPERGDVIAFYKSDARTGSMQIKRIIGVPGDTVQIKDGMILLNGETYLDESEFTKINVAGLAEEPVVLGREEYFVLGDNRNNSEDSRFIDMGNVQEKNIVGKVWLITSPWNRFAFL